MFVDSNASDWWPMQSIRIDLIAGLIDAVADYERPQSRRSPLHHYDNRPYRLNNVSDACSVKSRRLLALGIFSGSITLDACSRTSWPVFISNHTPCASSRCLFSKELNSLICADSECETFSSSFCWQLWLPLRCQPSWRANTPSPFEVNWCVAPYRLKTSKCDCSASSSPKKTVLRRFLSRTLCRGDASQRTSTGLQGNWLRLACAVINRVDKQHFGQQHFGLMWFTMISSFKRIRSTGVS